MNKGALLFSLLAGGYVLFELSMLHRLDYRLEVDHILDQMVSSQHAVSRCGNATSSQQHKYGKRLASLHGRATRELADSNPSLDALQITGLVANQVADLKQSVDVSIAELGCNSQEITTLMKRYTIYAGRD